MDYEVLYSVESQMEVSEENDRISLQSAARFLILLAEFFVCSSAI